MVKIEAEETPSSEGPGFTVTIVPVNPETEKRNLFSLLGI